MNLTHNPRLDWFSPGASKHPVFGQITEGFEIAMEISEVPTAIDNPEHEVAYTEPTYCAVCNAQTVHTPCSYTISIRSYQCALTSTHTPHTSEVPTTGDNPNTPIRMKSITISGL